jgi:hypothetical protein
MLDYRAEKEQTTISGVLAKELDGIASAHADELSAVIPCFEAAFAWPDAHAAELPC